MTDQESMIGKKYERLLVLSEKSVHIGYFNDLDDAAKARREWEIRNFKDFSPFASGREVNCV